MNKALLKKALISSILFLGHWAFGGPIFKFEKIQSYWPTSCNAKEINTRKDSQTFSVAGLHAVNGRILTAHLKDPSAVIITGEAYGYTCERLSSDTESFVWRPHPISQNPNVRVYVQSKFETYFRVSFTDPFKFYIEVPAEKFFTPQDFKLIQEGKNPKHNRFSLVYVAFDDHGNALPWTASYEFKFQFE